MLKDFDVVYYQKYYSCGLFPLSYNFTSLNFVVRRWKKSTRMILLKFVVFDCIPVFFYISQHNGMNSNSKEQRLAFSVLATAAHISVPPSVKTQLT
jgi:hypothetical protein